MQLENKIAIVTGAGQGIGRGIAHRFAKEGARVVVAEWKAHRGERVVAELEKLGAEFEREEGVGHGHRQATSSKG